MKALLYAPIYAKACKVRDSRPPDFIIRDAGGQPYLNRWYLIPRNRLLNVYVHEFLANDPSAPICHDHPWLFALSFVLEGSYLEVRHHASSHMIDEDTKLEKIQWDVIGAGMSHKTRLYTAPAVHGWTGRHPHYILCKDMDRINKRLDTDGPAASETLDNLAPDGPNPLTLFITGPVVRDWGFLTPQGWKHWRKMADITKDGNKAKQ